MPADLRYRVVGPVAVAGVRHGETLRAEAEPDEHGRHRVGADLVNLAAAAESGLIEPLSKTAAEAAGLSLGDEAEQAGSEAGADG